MDNQFYGVNPNPYGYGYQNENKVRTLDLVKDAVKDKMFVAICVLLTICYGSMLLAGSFEIIGILFVIFMWIVYSNANKGTLDASNLRNISGTIYAQYIISFVGAGLFIFLGLILGAYWSEGMELVEAELGKIDFGDNSAYQEAILEILTAPYFGVIIMVVLIIAAAIIIVLNLTLYRKLHRFAKALYISVENFDLEFVKKLEGAKVAMWVYGVLGALGLFSNTTIYTSSGGIGVFGTFANMCSAACYIIAAIWIKKYFVSVDMAKYSVYSQENTENAENNTFNNQF